MHHGVGALVFPRVGARLMLATMMPAHRKQALPHYQIVNTTANEELMDTPGTFGSIPPSDDEGGTDLDDDPDFEGHK